MNPFSLDTNLLQRHTVEIYNLDKQDGVLETVEARSLLSPKRFDLFAKLFYLKYKETEPEIARKLYLKHIKAFNPDGKEPGRDDKSSWEDFLKFFDNLTDNLRNHGFDKTLSLVPVGKDNIILDGAHRISILAYLNQPVKICRFDKVLSKGPFDYNYFINRGLPRDMADLIALEATNWLPEVRIACIWPRLENARKKDAEECMLNKSFPIFYDREFSISRKALTLLVTQFFQDQDWIGGQEHGYTAAMDNTYRYFARNRKIQFVFFVGDRSQSVSEIKEAIRETISYGKRLIYITDTSQEAMDLAKTILDEKERKDWLYLNNMASFYGKIHERTSEGITYFRNIVWLGFKARLARMLHTLSPE